MTKTFWSLLVVCGLLVGEWGGAQVSAADRVESEKQEIWMSRASYRYKTRALFAQTLEKMTGKIDLDLVRRIGFSKDLNSGRVNPEFKAQFKINYGSLTAPGGFEEHIKSFDDINAVLNVEPELTKTMMGFGTPVITPNNTKATRSVTIHLLFPQIKGGSKRDDLFENVNKAIWSEPTEAGVRLCRMQGGRLASFVECFEMTPDDKISVFQGGKDPTKKELLLPKSNFSISRGHDLVVSRESPVDSFNKPAFKKVKALISALEEVAKTQALLPEESKELTDLKALKAKVFPGRQ